MANNIKGITIDLGGDTTKLDKALSASNKEIKNTQSELKEVEKLLKLDPGNTELLAQKQKLLADAVGETKNKLDTLKEAEKQVQEQVQRGEASQQQYDALKREIIATENQLESLEEEAAKSNATLAKIGAVADDIGQKSEALGKKLLPVTAAITGIGAAALASFNEVDEGYDTIITKTGATGEALEDLQNSMDNVFSELPTDAESAGIAIGEVNTRFGETGETLETLSKDFIRFSEINGVDLNNSIGTVDKMMEQFNVTSDNTAGVLGLLTSKGQETGVSLDTLMTTVQKNGSTLKDMGLGLEESIVLLAEMEKNGVNSETAIAGLRKAVINYTKDGKSADEALRDTIDSIKNAKDETEALTIASEVFGSKGASEMARAIREGRLSVEDLSVSLQDYGNVVEDTFNATLDPPDQAKVALNNLKLAGADLANSMYSVVQPALDALSQKAREFSEWFRGLSDSQKELIVKIGAVVAAIGPALIVFGKLSQGVSTVTGIISKLGASLGGGAGLSGVLSALTGPVGIAIAAIAALAAGFIALYKNNEDFRNKVNETFAKVKEAFSQLKDAIQPAIEALKNAFLSLMTALQPVFEYIITKVMAIVQGVMAAAEPIIQAITNVVEFVTNIINAFMALIQGDWDAFGEYLMSALQNVIDFITNIITAIVSFVVGYLEGMGVDIKQIFTDIWNAIVSIFQGVGQWFADRWTDIVNAFSAAVTWFQTTFQNAYIAITNVFQAIGQWFAARWNDIKTALSTVATWFQTKFQEAYNNVERIFKAIGQWFAARWTDIKNALADVATWFQTKFQDAYNNVTRIFEAIGQWFASRWTDIKNALADVANWFQEKFQSAYRNVQQAFEKIGTWFQEKYKAITDVFEKIPNFFKEKFEDAVKTIKDVFGPIVDWFSEIADKIKGFFSGIADAIFGAVDDANDAADSARGSKSGKSSSTNYYADGGILTNGRGIVAEAGPELIEMVNGRAIITPLTDSATNTPVGAYGGGSSTVLQQHNSFYSPKALTPYETARLNRMEAQRAVLAIRGV